MRSTSIIPALALVLAAACGSNDDPPATPPAEAAPVAPVEVQAAEPAPAPALTASPITVPLHELEKDQLEAALRAGGWEIGTSSATRSAMYAVTTRATKNGTEATISYYRNGGSFWRGILERNGAAIHEDAEHEVLLGVVIESNREAQQPLLDSLLPRAQ